MNQKLRLWNDHRLSLPSCVALTVLLLCSPLLTAGEPCEPEWSVVIGQPGFNNEHAVRAMAEFQGDLYAVGDFWEDSGSPGDFIARWDGEQWSPVGGGFGVIGEQWCCNLYVLAVFDDGSGPALYAGGVFKQAGDQPADSIARWDGEQWTEVGGGVRWASIDVGGVEAMTVFDDGSGSALYVGGWFDEVGDTPAMSIARWDGESWSALGEGVGGVSPFPRVRALTVYDDGTGPALYAGGNFTTADGQTVNHIAKWDGEEWHALSSGANDLVLSFETWDDGSGEALYLGGSFSSVGGTFASRIARWDGVEFSSVGGGVTGGDLPAVLALQAYDDATRDGSGLFAGGFFTGMGGTAANHLARWSGSDWTALNNGVGHTDPFIAPRVNDLLVHDDGSGFGPALVTAGLFDSVGGVSANNVGLWGGCAEDDVPECPGDLDNDGEVNVIDLLLMLEQWGLCDDPDKCAADLNDDGEVGVLDLLLLLENWGPCP